MAVPRDNVREWRIGDKTYQLEASLGTGKVYRDEFFGKLGDGYKGILEDDMLRVFRLAQPVIEDEAGEVVENPDYYGYDVEALLRIAWAMARAEGCMRKGWDKFYAEVIHQPAGVFEEAALYDTVVMHLGAGITFRRPEGLGGAQEPDEANQEPEG